MKAKLFLVSIPIGNPRDITLRAIDTLQEVDFIVCEEYKEARRFLSKHNIEKELYSVNEHNEDENVLEIITLLKEGKTAALISDCGSPVFSDPGLILLNRCIEAKIEVTPVPGATSIIPALVGSGFKLNKFYFYGWLSPKKELRKQELLKLRTIKELLILMDTPYRLKTLLADVKNTFGDKTKICVAYKLTMPEEIFLRGTAKEILKIVEDKKLKGEFVLMIDNSIFRKTNKHNKLG